MQSSAKFAERFSPRERELVTKLMQGHSVKGIADELNISVNTVKDYLKTVYHKASVHSARELMVKLRTEHQASAELAPITRAIEKLLEANSVAEVLDFLMRGLRIHTGARRVSIWKITRQGDATFLIGHSGERQPAGPFIHEAMQLGVAALPLNRTDLVAERKRWQANGELAATRIASQRYPAVAIIADPDRGFFEPAELATARLLARIAGLRLDTRE